MGSDVVGVESCRITVDSSVEGKTGIRWPRAELILVSRARLEGRDLGSSVRAKY